MSLVAGNTTCITVVLLECVASRPVIGGRQQRHTDNRWVWGRLTGVLQMPDTFIIYVTHDDRPNISSASGQHGAKRRGGLCDFIWYASSRIGEAVCKLLCAVTLLH